jgi:hypothetical protein
MKFFVVTYVHPDRSILGVGRKGLTGGGFQVVHGADVVRNCWVDCRKPSQVGEGYSISSYARPVFDENNTDNNLYVTTLVFLNEPSICTLTVTATTGGTTDSRTRSRLALPNSQRYEHTRRFQDSRQMKHNTHSGENGTRRRFW